MKEKIMNKLNSFFQDGRGVFIIIFILEFLLMFFITPNKYDDEFFITQVTNELNEETGEIIEHTIMDFVINRYSTWSSRVLIEFVLCLMLKTSKYMWIFVEALMMTLCCYSLSKLFIKENKKENNIMLLFMILIYPFNVMNSTGWASSTINYIWPLATMLYALIPIRMIWDGEKIKLWQYPLFTLSLIFAGNHEQSCAILVGTYLLFTILYIIKNKKANAYMIIQTIIAILSIIFILTCPGNYVRKEAELELMPDFEMLTVIDKFVLGMTATMCDFIGESKLTFALISFVIMIYIFNNYEEKLYRIISVIPFMSFMMLTYLGRLTNSVFHYIYYFRNYVVQEGVVLNAANSNNIYNVVPIIFAFGMFICLGLSIALIFKKLRNNLALLVFLIGISSKLILGFSPTVFSSNARTTLFLEFAMIIVSIIIWNEMVNKVKNGKQDKKLMTKYEVIIKCTGVLQYLNVFLCILATQK